MMAGLILRSMRTSDKSSGRRRDVLKSIGAVGIAGIAGCTSSGEGDDEASPGTAENTSQNTSLDGQITIGTIGPMDARAGKELKVSTSMAVDEINGAGGIHGAELEIISKDNEGNDPGIAKRKYQELVVQENVDMVIGGWLGPSVEQMLTVDPNTSTPHFYLGSTMALTDKLRSNFNDYRNTFRIGEDIRQAAYNRSSQLKHIFSELDVSKVAFLFEDLGYNVGEAPILKEELGSEFDILMNKRYPANTKDFSSLFDQLEQKGVEGVFIEAFVTGTQAVLQWADQQRDFVMYGSIGSMQSPTGWKNSNGKAKGSMGNSYSIPGASRNELTTPFVKDFQEQAGYYPSYVGSVTYPTVYAFAEAVKRAKSLDKNEVVSELENTSLQTPLGKLEFQGKDDDFPHHAYQDEDHIYQQGFQWQQKDGKGIPEDEFYPNSGGVQECIWPPSDATQKPKKPDWVTF
jgi:branched-chain amino acid transport system substrate-binding protein